MRIPSKNSRWPYPPKPHQGGRQALGMGCHIKVTVKSPTAGHTLTIVLWCVKKVVWKHMGKSGYGQANYRNIQNFNQPPMHAARQQDAEYSAVNLAGSSIDVYHCQSAAIHYKWKFFAAKWNLWSVGPLSLFVVRYEDSVRNIRDHDRWVWTIVLPSRFKFHAVLLSSIMNIHFK